MIDIKLPIKELGLNTRALHWLKAEANIKTIEDLILHESMLLKYPNIGNVTNDHIKEKLAIHNLYLKTDRKFLKKEKKKMTDSRPYVRKLTDEEMLEVYKKLFNKKNEFKENLKRRSYFDFAKAILKAASEK